MPAPLRKRFMARYVVLAEAVGYGFAALLLILWVAFFFIRMDEHCYAPGIATPATLEVKTDDRAVVDAVLVRNEELVRKGQAIVRLNLEKKSIAARQSQEALQTLGEQIITLADDPQYRASLQRTVAGLVQDVGGIATGTEMREITAPESGILHFLTTGSLEQRVVQGVVAQVVSDNRLQVEATLGTLNRDRVKVGQPAKIILDLSGGDSSRPSLLAGTVDALKKLMPGGKTRRISEVVGTVIELPAADKVLIEAPVKDPAIGRILSDQVLRPAQAPEPLKAEAKVVVDNIRLVKFLFQRTTPPGDITKKGEEKKEPLFKRLWHKVFPAKEAETGNEAEAK